MSLMLNNSLLKAAEAQVESKLLPANRSDYTRIVVAGMKIGLDKGPNSILASLQHSKDPINDAAVGAINLCLLMHKHSRGTMPMKAMVPAAMSLMLHALDFADRAKIIKVDSGVLIKASRIFTNHIFKMFHITGPMLQTAASKLHGMMQDPAKMQKIKEASGTVVAPGAQKAGSNAL